MKWFDMGTWEIVDTADIPPECSVMGTCFSFKIKCDSEGKLLCWTRANANGTQQRPGTYGETFASTLIQIQRDTHDLRNCGAGKSYIVSIWRQRCIFAGTMQGASIHESAGQVQIAARKSSQTQEVALQIETKCIWIHTSHGEITVTLV